MQNLSNPLNAPDAPKPVYRNTVRITKNEVGDMPLALKERQNPPVSADTYVPFWTIEGETLDAAFSNGDPFPFRFGTKLIDKNGKALDKRQRPYIMATAFAALGINAFPGDEAYVEADVIGKTFVMQSVDPEFGPRYSVPVEALPDNYEYTGDVRIIQTRAERAAAGPEVVANGTGTAAVDLASNADALSAFLSVIDGVSVNDVTDVLLDSNAGTGAQFGGKSVNALALNGTLLEVLADNGYVSVEDGKVVVA